MELGWSLGPGEAGPYLPQLLEVHAVGRGGVPVGREWYLLRWVPGSSKTAVCTRELWHHWDRPAAPAGMSPYVPGEQAQQGELPKQSTHMERNMQGRCLSKQGGGRCHVELREAEISPREVLCPGEIGLCCERESALSRWVDWIVGTGP